MTSKPASKPRTSRRRLAATLGVTLGALAAALAPSLGVGVTEADAREGRVQSPRQRALAQMATNPGALINVSYSELPSSPDVLNLGKRGTRALERCLQDNAHTAVRAECARYLRALGDRSALPTLRASLADWEPMVRYAVIQALGRMPDEASFEPLHKLYQREDESLSNRLAIIDTLGALGSHRAVRVLRAELRKAPRKGEGDRRAQIFMALLRSRHLVARQTLVGDVAYVLGLKDNEWALLQGTSAAAELGSGALVRSLVPLMSHRSAEVRNKAVYALGKIGDPTATRALLDHLPKVREARMLNNIAFALERLNPDAFFPAIEELAASKQAVIRLNAAFVLGDVRRPESLPALSKALKDPSDFVRVNAVVAIGKLAEPKGIAALEPFQADPDFNIREEAIYATHRLSGGKHEGLIYDQLFNSEDAKRPERETSRRRAAITLGKQGDTRVRQYLLSCFERYQCSARDIDAFVRQDKDTRTHGRLLLDWTRGRTELTQLIGSLKPPGSVAIAQASFDESLAHSRIGGASRSATLLGDLGDQAVRPRLSSVEKHQNTWLRLSAGVARLRLGDTQLVAPLMQDLDNLPSSSLPSAVRLLSRVSEAPARKALESELVTRTQHADPQLAVAARAVLAAWDPDKQFFGMLDALSAPSTEVRELAVSYLRRNTSTELTWAMRRALSREQRPYTRDQLRVLLDTRS
ncbi:MAG: HEAT repeat domain-containing protein [Polyangiaceae bacterium]|nr:HEAT repeat domain-containing protein [Polyangiaceae bacterium]MCW5789701.1 HEAT repeat domain-containing protein [Polyangiaceae bacterium]